MKPRLVSGHSVALVLLGSGIVASCSSAGSIGPFASIVGDAGASGLSDGAVPGFDGGSGGSSSGSSGSSSGGLDAASSPPPPTTLLAVHASANLPDFRLCFGVAGTGVLPWPAYPDDPAHPMPETNYPGVPVGGAALLPAQVFPAATVTPYLVPAQSLYGQTSTTPGGETTCDRLICSAVSCLASNAYFTLPDVTLPTGGTTMLAVTGCGVGSGFAFGSVAQCGASYTAASGNLAAVTAPLTTVGEDGGWTVEALQLSPSFAGSSGGGSLVYVNPIADASVPIALSASIGSPTTLPLGEAGVGSAYFSLTPAGGAAEAQPLGAIQFFQAPSSDPFTYFSGGSAYFVAVVGDATDAAAPASLPDGAANPAFDGHGLHVIAYPESP
jgi:hypothetical protein